MYHKTAEQLAKELIVIPDPRYDDVAKAAKLVVLEFGPIEVIDNYVKAHVAVGRVVEKINQEDTRKLSSCLGIMFFLEELMAKAILGEDKITIIKIL